MCGGEDCSVLRVRPETLHGVRCSWPWEGGIQDMGQGPHLYFCHQHCKVSGVCVCMSLVL